jgi:hypothetical protein
MLWRVRALSWSWSSSLTPLVFLLLPHFAFHSFSFIYFPFLSDFPVYEPKFSFLLMILLMIIPVVVGFM